MELGTLNLVMNKNILESNIVFIVIIKSIFFSYDSPRMIRRGRSNHILCASRQITHER